MRLHWTSEDIATYLEYKMMSGLNNENEYDMYLNYIENGKFNKKEFRNTYRTLVRELKEYHNNGF